MPKAQKIAVVNDVIRVLGLEHIARTPVGNVEKRGISGGERKRVRVGLELETDPSLHFLDEPTSGLDSITSIKTRPYFPGSDLLLTSALPPTLPSSLPFFLRRIPNSSLQQALLDLEHHDHLGSDCSLSSEKRGQQSFSPLNLAHDQVWTGST